MDENDLDRIITNDEDPEGYHVFIGTTKMDETKNLTSKSRFLGSFVLSYSRLMLDNIINAAYGEDRFNISSIDKQIYNGDADSVLVNVYIAKNHKKRVLLV